MSLKEIELSAQIMLIFLGSMIMFEENKILVWYWIRYAYELHKTRRRLYTTLIQYANGLIQTYHIFDVLGEVAK